MAADVATVESTKLDDRLLEASQERAWDGGKPRRTHGRSADSIMKVNPHELAIELLTREWDTVAERMDPASRLYLAESLLPVLVGSLEQLLVTVTRRGLEEQDGFRDDFNPVNFVAEYLMRNNPRYPHLSRDTSSRYYEGLKEVAARLKRQLAGDEEQTVQIVREQLQQKREAEEEATRQRLEEEERRRNILNEMSRLWQVDNIIMAQQIYQVTEAWLQSKSGEDLRDKFQDFLSHEVTPDTCWSEEELIKALQPLSVLLSKEDFGHFTDYLKVCGNEKRRAENKQKRRTLLEKIFQDCDVNNLKAIDRKHIMNLFTIFYDHASEGIKKLLTDPRTWPASGQSVDDVSEEEWEREGSTVSDEDYQQFMISPSHTASIPTEETPPTTEETPPTTEAIPKTLSPELPESYTDTFRTETRSSHYESLPSPAKTLIPSGLGEQWSPKHVNQSQFFQLCDLLLGEDDIDNVAAESLGTFLRNSFTSDGNDFSRASEPVQHAMLQLRKAHKINDLFSFWDNDCSGYLHMEELLAVLSHWKDFSSEEAKKEIEGELEKLSIIGQQVNRNQFSTLLNIITDEMQPAEFKQFLDLMNSSIKLTHEQQQRNLHRQKLLNNIRRAGYGVTGQIDTALEAAVKAIQQDCKQYKKVGVSIALLDRSHDSIVLNYKASSDDGAYYVLGKRLNQSQAPVSFSVVHSGRSVHVPNVHKHGRVFFFIPEHSQEQEYHGSLVVSPIISPNSNHVVGTISVDTLQPSSKNKLLFDEHEIAFYQGVGVCLGEVHHSSLARKKLLGAAEAGIVWLLRRCPVIMQIDFYLIRPEEKQETEYMLQLALHSNQSLGGKIEQSTTVLRKKDNFFREYLFQCVDTSESVTTEVYCNPHLCCPLRDLSGCAVAVLDITLTEKTSGLDSQYTRDINKMIKLLTSAFHQAATSEDDGEESVTALFHQLLLADLQLCMSKLNKKTFAELRSYIEPPPMILSIMRVLIMILYPSVECSKWTQCKPYITIDLLKLMVDYKPSLNDTNPQLDTILQILQEISPKEVFRHGSLPTKYLYTWVSACSAVMEHSSNIDSTAAAAATVGQ